MAVRVLHVSDLHIGRRDDLQPLLALRELAARLDPELVLVTGDLTHRGRRGQLERASELLRGLGLPLLAVPGNHDIPYTFPARFTRTFTEWQRIFGAPEPVHASDHLLVVGLSSVRPWRHEGGAVSEARLAEAASRLREAPAGALRMVALHHHLAAPPWRAKRKRPLRRRDHVLQTLAAAGAELVVGGHVHQAAIAERREFENVQGRSGGSLVLATVAGLGRPRPRRRGEARGVNVYEADAETITATTYAWADEVFEVTGRRSFSRR